MCSNPNCSIICHSICPAESKVHKIPMFARMSCFEIAHHEYCNGLFVQCNMSGGTYTRSVKNHPLPKLVQKAYERLQPRRSDRTSRGRPRTAMRTTTTNLEVNGNDQNSTATSIQQQPPVEIIQTRSKNNNQRQRSGDGGDLDSVAELLISNITTTNDVTGTPVPVA